MSVRNGDKARFSRLRKQKILLRKRTREMQDAVEIKTTENNCRVRVIPHTPLTLEPVG